MAATRKLQAEVDRTLKAVGEHMTEFDSVWSKIHSAPSQNLKDKYENDLKKEIKKLQRLRETIKTWAQSSDIKNKKPLLDARHKIETEMERFKSFERETKTKAYSKEGLMKRSSSAGGSSTSAGGGDDDDNGGSGGASAANECVEWIDNAVGALDESRTELQSKLDEIVRGGNASKKKGKKSEIEAETSSLQHRIDRHTSHIKSLRQIRYKIHHRDRDHIDNGDGGNGDSDVAPIVDNLQSIQESIDDYIENSGDTDYVEDESLYDVFELSEDGEYDEDDDDDVDADADVPSADDDADNDDANDEDEQKEDDNDDHDSHDDKRKPTSATPTATAARVAQPTTMHRTQSQPQAPPVTKPTLANASSAPKAAATTSGVASTPSTPAAVNNTRPNVSVITNNTNGNNSASTTPVTSASTAASSNGRTPIATPSPAARTSSTPQTTLASTPSALQPAKAPSVKPGPSVPAVIPPPPIKPQSESLASIVMKSKQAAAPAPATPSTTAPASTTPSNATTMANKIAAAPPATTIKPREPPGLIQLQRSTSTTSSALAAPQSSSSATSTPSSSLSSQSQSQSQSQPQATSSLNETMQTSSSAAVTPLAVSPAASPMNSPQANLLPTQAAALVSGMILTPQSQQINAQQQQQQQQLMQQQQQPLSAASLLSPTASPVPMLHSPLASSGLGGLPMAVSHELDIASSAASAASSSFHPSLAHFSPLPSLAVSLTPAEPPHYKDRERGLLADDYAYTLSLLEPSLSHMPEPSDTDRPKQYIPRNPYRTPNYFPSLPAPIFDTSELFEKLSIDTLFFIFYFQQGTPHQYLSARELKRQSWRYHKNFLTWFQRHDDPKLTTDEYEQGTYVYFDYESGWCQRIKQDFTFEYRHLEDELAVPLSAPL